MLLAAGIGTAEIGSAADTLSERAVRLLKMKCVSCHGPEQAEGSLRLDSHERMLAGGQRGPAVLKEQAEESLLLLSITGGSNELQMPPKQPLSAQEVSLLREWLQNGAVWPDLSTVTMQPQSPDSESIGDAWSDARNPIVKIFGGERLGLWSLQPPVPQTPPVAKQMEWVKQELDHFTLARLENHHVDPPKSASRHQLVRRLYFDLIGLPPAAQTVEEFEAVGSQAEWDKRTEQLVDQLLDSPRFGEHWARQWLDVVRYSDSNGFDWDEFRPQAWRYRDYVIRSFNADKPFDQFVREQLAGDEMLAGPPVDAAQQDLLIATGYLRMGPHDNAAKLFNEQDRSRDELLIDLVETTGTAFLGLTLSCCRCHDHKFDPISHVDYFRIRASFAGVQFADDLLIDLADQQQEIERQNAEVDQQIAAVESELAGVLDKIRQRVASNDAPSTAGEAAPNQEPALSEKELRQAADDQERTQLKAMDEQVTQLRKRKLPFTHAMVMIDQAEPPPPTFVLFQGDYKAPRQPVEPGFLSALDPNPMVPANVVRKGSSGRRTALANWIASADNPLTARVFVNRVWQQLMGHGLVRTSGDFGLAGLPPDEPELLDWLALRFVQDGWSLKRLVRLIVLSATYQQESRYDQLPTEVSHLFRRPRRLAGEQLRDAMLTVSGLMTDKSAGTPEWPDLPAEVLEANPAFLDDNETKTKGWYPSPTQAQHCRSIFLVQKRNTRVPLLETYDQPENSVACTCRATSVVPAQALAMLNNPEAVRSAKALAERVTQAEKLPIEQIQLAFALTLQRKPTSSEQAACMQMLQQTSLLELCRVLLNVNEFAFID